MRFQKYLYKISRHNSTQLTKATVKAAYETRKPTESLLFHSDQGSNYTSSEFRKYLKTLISYNRFQILECHTIIRLWSLSSVVLSEKHYIATVSKRKKIFFEGVAIYIHFYNGKRPHSVLMNRTPDKFESKYFNNNNKKTNFETEH